MIKRIYDANFASACFFRTSVQLPDRKAMLQITERCNLRCAHCFVNSGNIGDEMSLDAIRKTVIPQFIKSRVIKVTLTGGEPLVHKDAMDVILSFLSNGIGVSVCTNGILIKPTLIDTLCKYDNVHFNVSLDGFRAESHGRFRGGLSCSAFSDLIRNIRLLGERGLLNGILTTPNKYATLNEYEDLCRFAKDSGAKYLLMNPLSPFGRGTKTQPLAYSEADMTALRARTLPIATGGFEIVYIRFPNTDRLPIGACSMGMVPYIFCNGDVAICPYMVFASQSDTNHYQPDDFLLGNIFNDFDLALAVDQYHLPSSAWSDAPKGADCSGCQRGCYAIKISNDQPLASCDNDLCPKAGELI